MNWVLLIASGMMEAVWAVSLDKSEGFSHPIPTLVFIVFYIASVVGLRIALKTIPVGTGYAVWVGIGAFLTIAYSLVTGAESFSVVKVLLLAGLVGCVIGLKLVSD